MGNLILWCLASGLADTPFGAVRGQEEELVETRYAKKSAEAGGRQAQPRCFRLTSDPVGGRDERHEAPGASAVSMPTPKGARGFLSAVLGRGVGLWSLLSLTL